jgi:hypothetical protein
MRIRPGFVDRLVLALVVVVSLAALGLTFLAPGFRLDNGLVYGGF